MAPLWQSPQCFVTPHSETSPQKRPSHDGGAQGAQSDSAEQKLPLAHAPQSIESPQVFLTTPHPAPRDAHDAAGDGSGTHTAFWHVSSALQLPQSSIPPQPSD